MVLARMLLLMAAIAVIFRGAGEVARAQTPPSADDDNERQNRSRLQTLGAAAADYYQLKGKLPDRISDLFNEGFILNFSTFVRPQSSKQIAAKEQIDDLADYAIATAVAPERPMILAWERRAADGGQALAFYSDRTFKKVVPPSNVPDAVPNVIGLSVKDAESKLAGVRAKADFALGDPAPAADKALTVYATRPAAGTALGSDRRIEATIYAPSVAQHVIPDLVGLSVKEAEAKLAGVGAKADFTLGDPAPSADKALTVYATRPAAGAPLDAGKRIQATIYAQSSEAEPRATDARLKVPDLIGLSVKEAEAKLAAVGAAADFTLGDAAPSADKALTVYATDPAAGKSLGAGTRIQATIYAR